MSKSVRKDPIFTGPFAKMCVAFVSYKRAQGIKYMGQIYLLRAFDDFCKDFKIESQNFLLKSLRHGANLGITRVKYTVLRVFS